MLKLMNRRNKVKSDLELFEYLADKGYALGTDFIVGHPGESDELWSDAMQNLDKFPLTHCHSFTYSKRDGTLSSQMNMQVNGAVAKKRLKQLDEKIKDKNFQFRKKQKHLDILIESKKIQNTKTTQKSDIYTGYDQFFNIMEIESKEDIVGDWLSISNYKAQENHNVSKF